MLATGHSLLEQAERGQAEGEPVAPEAGAGRLGGVAYAPVVVAVGSTADACRGRGRGRRDRPRPAAPLEVVHVRETAVVEELAIEPEDEQDARAACSATSTAWPPTACRPAGRCSTVSATTRPPAGSSPTTPTRSDARLVAVGPSPRGTAAQLAEGSLTTALTHADRRPVVLLEPDKEPRHR